jgi:hypothetical protein
VSALVYTGLFWLACYTALALIVSWIVISLFDDRLGNPFYFFFVSVPVGIAIPAAWLLVVTYETIVGPRCQQQFVQEPPLPSPSPQYTASFTQDPAMSSLKSKVTSAQQEHIDLILKLTGDQVDRGTLIRALEREIIHEIAVRKEEVTNHEQGGNDVIDGEGNKHDTSFERTSTTKVTGVSFVLRPPRLFADERAETEPTQDA